ncbi:MAG TPA: glutamate-1-semialdehyde-2,1-aminomutase [Cryomorphaceae bacterium]|nr:glutamate-1-semialdehyde-2,1-aminomutase [Cryomorphaceae bacterium]
MYPQSKLLFERSKRIIPGGVNSPVRAFGSVGGTPIFIKSAKGSRLVDVDGREYVDFINSWGPMILGHQFDPVIEAVQDQLSTGVSYGCPTEAENTMASLITEMAPWVDKVRLTSSGTEACMSALRVARGYTGKNKFIKFAGNYHGHADPFLVKAGSGLLTFAVPGSAGVPEGATQDTLIAEYNNLESVASHFEREGDKMAAIIVEPVAGNMGCIPPKEGFLEGLRALCDQHGAVLILDEVMTGFRLAPGGAAERLGIQPDMVTFGKVIGGGMPVAAFGGKAEIMNVLAPNGPVYQAGTLSGNPISTASGIATLSYLKTHPEVYEEINATTAKIEGLLQDRFRSEEVAINRLGSMISIHFGTYGVANYTDATNAQNDRFNALFHHLLKAGIYLPPSAFESWFISRAINDEDLGLLAVGLKSFEG